MQANSVREKKDSTSFLFRGKTQPHNKRVIV